MRAVVFIIGGLIALAQLLAGNKCKRNLLFLIGLYPVISVGWIFYHYTGFWLMDFPVLILLFISAFKGPRFRFVVPYVGRPLILLFIWLTISSFLAINQGWALAELSKYLRAYLVFICVTNNARDKSHLQALLNGIFVALFFESLVGMWQWRFGYAGLWALGENADAWRASGTFFVPHYLGNFMIFVLPLVLRLLVFQKAERPVWSYIYSTMAAFGVIALFATYTRGPWLSFIISMALMFIFSFLKSKWRPRVRWAMVLMVLMGFVFLYRYSPVIINQFGGQRDASRDIRFDQFRIAYRVILGHPLFGTGLENYELVSPGFVTPEERLDPRSFQYDEMVHNSYLYFTAQAGMVSMAILLYAVIRFLLVGLKVIHSKSIYVRNISIGILMGFLSIFIALLSAPDIRSEQLLFQAGIMAGLLFSVYFLDLHHQNQTHRRGKPSIQPTTNHKGNALQL